MQLSIKTRQERQKISLIICSSTITTKVKGSTPTTAEGDFIMLKRIYGIRLIVLGLMAIFFILAPSTTEASPSIDGVYLDMPIGNVPYSLKGRKGNGCNADLCSSRYRYSCVGTGISILVNSSKRVEQVFAFKGTLTCDNGAVIRTGDSEQAINQLGTADSVSSCDRWRGGTDTRTDYTFHGKYIIKITTLGGTIINLDIQNYGVKEPLIRA